MARQFPYTFERIEEQSPTPCAICDDMSEDFWIAIKLGDSLATSVCSECAHDVIAATNPRASEDALHACADCPRTFATAAALGSHRRSHRVPTAA